ncbi:dihydrofolate reductase family protein [Frateuria hangzhouensis]|uniref:dihydrofolate reductase family protein n=1 Tax=Frateuria hangzhouensis TaxID=2995589 RepID=UPI0022608A2A|nr:dihydrofolate reductase family protein [Frateuria sp. STR12]MCX7515179.1 dihydrofolate reductase family protein [Frateuria sp. STR12]
MRSLKLIEHISLDGVVQHGTDENGFPYEGWIDPYRTPQGLNALLAAQGHRFDLLLGRRTYDIWSDSWGKAAGSPMADGINAATKYVATHHPDDLRWGPFEAVGPDLRQDVLRLKAQTGPELVVWGSSTLTSTLLEYGLVDDILLIVYPVWLGTGKRLFAEGTPAHSFELVGTQAMPSGILFNTYKSAGPLKASGGD